MSVTRTATAGFAWGVLRISRRAYRHGIGGRHGRPAAEPACCRQRLQVQPELQPLYHPRVVCTRRRAAIAACL
eukprot:1228829-Prymnesium_polylepis.1